MSPVEVGLVGAGPWAKLVHGPVLAAGPETTLAGIWARRYEAAERLAQRLGVLAFRRLEDLLDVSEAVAFAVPPRVQASLALQAAHAGKALLLEKPIAADLADAERLVDATENAGVVTQLALTWRYAAAVRSYLADAKTFNTHGGRGWFVSAGMLGNLFATPWRLERGALLDVGPHVLDLLEAALGPILEVRAHGDARRWVGLLVDHEAARFSEVSISADIGIDLHTSGVSIYGPDGERTIDCSTAVSPQAFATMRAEFAAAVRSGQSHALDIHRGLRLQQLIAAAEADLK